jgi:hypothetical protein
MQSTLLRSNAFYAHASLSLYHNGLVDQRGLALCSSGVCDEVLVPPDNQTPSAVDLCSVR